MTCICSVAGCGRVVWAVGLCGTHYQRKRTTGDVMADVEIGRSKSLAWLLRNMKPDSDDCVFWPFSFLSGGYGQLSIGKKPWLAHRFVCVACHGDPPFLGAQAAHSCGNRGCINERHIRWATAAENAQDRENHGNTLKGEAHGQAKLTNDQARDIFLDTRSQSVIAADYGVTKRVIGNIKRGESYKEATRMCRLNKSELGM